MTLLLLVLFTTTSLATHPRGNHINISGGNAALRCRYVSARCRTESRRDPTGPPIRDYAENSVSSTSQIEKKYANVSHIQMNKKM